MKGNTNYIDLNKTQDPSSFAVVTLAKYVLQNTYSKSPNSQNLAKRSTVQAREKESSKDH